ncbi:N-acetyltransferase [Neobacillus mesonae]|uniref:N-acetyltransferase n=1 Tax=Neobacillus mesonae TaxID=1193713 RepID=UPI000832F558|nr:N-acetyltransferase [Neobacillus mesonae]MED4206891.1 N-acetyltransferase [Neobacillus mesonae]
MEIYQAVAGDVKDIYKLIKFYADKEVVLPRTYLSLYQHLQCLHVMKEKDEILGVAGLHVLGQDLAEVRSLVVAPHHSGKGIGRQLVEQMMKEAEKLQISRVISLTYETEFFKKCGFEIVSRDSLPEKVWIDCMTCPKFDCCDEVAMMKYVESL